VRAADNSWCIRGCRIVDPGSGREEVADLAMRDGKIAELPAPPGVPEIAGEGLTAVPALIDLHVHLREPGAERTETVASGSRAAARGGFGTVLAMPNTQPPIDTPQRVAELLAKGAASGRVRVMASACITIGRAGRELADLAALAGAGAAAFTDDGSTVPDAGLLHRAMQRAAELGLPILDHALDPTLAGAGVMHEGARARALGYPGIPAEAERRIVARDARLARETGCALHIQHVSTREAVQELRAALRTGARISAELTPHHLALIDEDVHADSVDHKMNPPLGSRADRAALRDAVVDGTICAFATDHAPHSPERKAQGFLSAPFGVVGLETAVGVTHTELVDSGRMPLSTWVHRWTCGPAAVLGLPEPTLVPGAPADVTLLELDTPWSVRPADFVSKSSNTPFAGKTLTGRCVATFLAGCPSYAAPGLLPA